MHSLWPSKGTVGSLNPFWRGRLHEIAERLAGKLLQIAPIIPSTRVCARMEACVGPGAPRRWAGEVAQRGRGRDMGVGFCSKDAPERRGRVVRESGFDSAPSKGS